MHAWRARFVALCMRVKTRPLPTPGASSGQTLEPLDFCGQPLVAESRAADQVLLLRAWGFAGITNWPRAYNVTVKIILPLLSLIVLS